MMAPDTLRAALELVAPAPWTRPALPTGWPELDAALPDHGFPRGVVELAAPRALGGGTSIALALVHAALARDARAWCAWVDPAATLYAPAVASAGVDLGRLFVVRPPPRDAGRIAVKVTEAQAFDVVVIDGLADVAEPRARARGPSRAIRSEILARKLALAAERSGATVLLLTDSLAPREAPWPVALRLELGRAPGHVVVTVAKERRGRAGLARAIVPMRSRPRLVLA